MLPADRRMRRSEEFRRTVRSGRRAGSRTLVVHVLEPGASAPGDFVVPSGPADPARVGLVVGRGVGGSVVRSQVSRRIRHVLRARVDALPAGALLVVRALAPAGSATSAALAADIDRAFSRLGLRVAAEGAA